MVDPVTGDLYIVTKNWSLLGRSSIYRAPAGLKAGSTTVLQKLGDVKLPRATLVTGGDISSDGRVIALRSYTAVRLYERTAGQSVAAALQSKPCTGPRPARSRGRPSASPSTAAPTPPSARAPTRCCTSHEAHGTLIGAASR